MIVKLPIDPIAACPMDARVAAAFIHLRQTRMSLEALRTGALEAIDKVFTGPSVAARVAGTFIDVNVAHFSCRRKHIELDKNI